MNKSNSYNANALKNTSSITIRKITNYLHEKNRNMTIRTNFKYSVNVALKIINNKIKD